VVALAATRAAKPLPPKTNPTSRGLQNLEASVKELQQENDQLREAQDRQRLPSDTRELQQQLQVSERARVGRGGAAGIGRPAPHHAGQCKPT
jgi:hypothetical protein